VGRAHNICRVMRSACNIVVGKPGGRVPRCGWKNNYKMNLRDTGRGLD